MVSQFLSVPSKCQTRGSVLEQLSLPCPETRKARLLKQFQFQSIISSNRISRLLLFHISCTNSQTHRPSNQPTLELHQGKTMTILHYSGPFAWIDREPIMRRKDPLHDVPPVKLPSRITSFLDFCKATQNLEGIHLILLET